MMEQAPTALPDGERAALASFPVLRRLDAGSRDRLLRLGAVFLRDVKIDGMAGVSPTPLHRAWVAASCALLHVGRPDWPFPPVRRVVLSPMPFDAKTYAPSRDGTLAGFYSAKDGGVWMSVDRLVDSNLRDSDGYNVGIHEFAHALDGRIADGISPRMSGAFSRAWVPVLRQAMTAAGMPSGALDRCAAKNMGEAFGVAVETFFETPQALRTQDPDLYARLSEFLGQNPADGDSWAAAHSILDVEVRRLSQARPEAGILAWVGTVRRVVCDLPGGETSAVPFDEAELSELLAGRTDDRIAVEFERDGLAPVRICPAGSPRPGPFEFASRPDRRIPRRFIEALARRFPSLSPADAESLIREAARSRT